MDVRVPRLRAGNRLAACLIRWHFRPAANTGRLRHQVTLAGRLLGQSHRAAPERNEDLRHTTSTGLWGVQIPFHAARWLGATTLGSLETPLQAGPPLLIIGVGSSLAAYQGQIDELQRRNSESLCLPGAGPVAARNA